MKKNNPEQQTLSSLQITKGNILAKEFQTYDIGDSGIMPTNPFKKEDDIESWNRFELFRQANDKNKQGNWPNMRLVPKGNVDFIEVEKTRTYNTALGEETYTDRGLVAIYIG
jgi:hypothetical protein